MAGKRGMISKRSVLYWTNKGMSIDDANFERKKYMPGTFEYFKYFKGMDDISSKDMVIVFSNNRKHTLKNFIKRYGELDGKIRWDSYRKKHSTKNTFEYKNKKYGWDKNKFDEFNKSRSVTLNNFIKRYGKDVGENRWKSYREIQKYTKSSEYFIEKYGKIEGSKKWKRINFLKSHTYESYLERFNGNIEKATEALSAYYSIHRTATSKISIELFDKLRDLLDKRGIKQIYYKPYNQEWYIHKNKNFYQLDFFVKEFGKVIEFFGDYWHANPKIYEKDELINHRSGKIRMVSEVWKEDKDRIKNIKKVDYIRGIMIVWESDYRSDSEKTIKTILDFLYEN